jgi:hypothetical protein
MSSRRFLAAAGLVLLVALAVALGRAEGAGTPTASVSPDDNLVDSQIVDVSWGGFTPNAPLYIRLCAADATDTSLCTLPAGDLDHYTSSGTGGGIVRFRVVAKNLGAFECGDGHPCSIAVLQSPTDLASGVIVPIAYAPTPGTCPDSDLPPVPGEGASAAAFTFYRWQSAACQLESHLNVTYTNDNSFDGITGFANSSPNTDFAVSGMALPGTDAFQLAHDRLGYAYAPFTLTGIALAYNIVDRDGHQVKRLVLTPELVAKIATNKISTFNCVKSLSDAECVSLAGSDPAIRELNPDVKFPSGPVHFYIRAEHSASNLAFTTWLDKVGGRDWRYGRPTTWPPPDPQQCVTCPAGVQGEGNTGLSVGFPNAYTPSDVYIAVVDTTYAALNDVPVARIRNPGQPKAGIAPNADSLKAALQAGHENANGTIAPDYVTSDPDAYALPMLTYAVVPTSKGWTNFTSDDADTLSGFLKFAVTDGQRALPPGSFPLPADLVKQTKDVAAKVAEPGPRPPAPQPHDSGNDGNGEHSNSGSGGGGSGGGGSGGGSGGTGDTGGSGSGGDGGTIPDGSQGGNGTDTQPAPAAPTPAPATGAAITEVGNRLASPVSGALLPLLALLGVVLLLALPFVLLNPRTRPAAASAWAQRLAFWNRSGTSPEDAVS